MIVNLLRVVNEYSVWPDGTLQCTVKSENSVCLSRARLLFGEISDSIFWLQDSSYRSLQLSCYRVNVYRLSIVCRRSSIVYHQSSIYQFIFIRHCHVYVGDWSTLAACWHSTCLVLRWGVVTSAAAVCDACRHPSPCSAAGTGLLVTTLRRLSPVFVIVDEGCDCCQASTSWTSVLSSWCYWFDQCS